MRTSFGCVSEFKRKKKSGKGRKKNPENGVDLCGLCENHRAFWGKKNLRSKGQDLISLK